eukprot:6492200-Amphidinium_carterae.1
MAACIAAHKLNVDGVHACTVNLASQYLPALAIMSRSTAFKRSEKASPFHAVCGQSLSLRAGHS